MEPLWEIKTLDYRGAVALLTSRLNFIQLVILVDLVLFEAKYGLIEAKYGLMDLQDASAGWTQPQPDPNQWNGAAAAAAGYYGYNQGYESYGYAPPAQDPNMYAYGAYPGYGNYQQQQV